MTEAFKRIMTGLKEAEAYLKGDLTGVIVHHVDVPTKEPATLVESSRLSENACVEEPD